MAKKGCWVMWLWKRWCPQGWSPRAWGWDCSIGGRRPVASRILPYPALPGKCRGLQRLSCPFFLTNFFSLSMGKANVKRPHSSVVTSQWSSLWVTDWNYPQLFSKWMKPSLKFIAVSRASAYFTAGRTDACSSVWWKHLSFIVIWHSLGNHLP